jgi:hypothetical protein
MKRGTPEHPKIMDFAEAIHAKLIDEGVDLPLELAHSLACGIFERLCHYTARYAPAGDIGKHSNTRIAYAVGWKYDATWLVGTLTACRIIDAHEACRLYIHDWHEHSDDAADKWLHDKDLTYANGHCTRRGKKSRLSHDPVATQSRQPEPKPKPSSEPESSSSPRPKPVPEVGTASRSWDLDSSWDEDKAEQWARDIARQIPPRNASDARRWCAIAIAAQTTFSEDWFRHALDEVSRKVSKEGPHAHFNSIINKSAIQKNVLDPKAFLNSIPVPEQLTECLAPRARSP